MSQPQRSGDDLLDLLADYCNGELAAADAKRLADRLRDEEESRATYVRFMDIHSTLRWSRSPVSILADEESPEESPAPSPRSRSWLDHASARPTWPSIVVAATVMVTALGWMAFTYLPGVAENKNKPAAEAQDDVIARLVRVHDIEWADGGVPPSTRYKSGTRLAFTKGLVAIRYTTGAEVVIEGPAEYFVGDESGNGKADSGTVLSPANSGHLARGKLVARCETKASQGFTVCTPYACIEDHGTEFGVDVDERGAAEFAVLSGVVDVISDRGDGSEQRVRLVEGEGATVASRNARITKRRKVDVRFVTAMRSRLKMIGVTPATGDAQAGLFRVDLAKDAGSAVGWGVATAAVGPTPIADLPVGGDSDVTLAITTPDGISANTEGAPQTSTTIDGVRVPPQARDDYVWSRKNGGSILFEFANLDAGTYNVSVFEGRTSDSNGQFGKVWVGTLAEEPGSENTGDFAGSSATLTGLTIGAGDSVFYRHLEDNVGGTSGIIVRRTAVASEPSPAARGKEPEEGKPEFQNLK